MITMISPAKRLSTLTQAKYGFDTFQPQLLEQSQLLVSQLSTYDQKKIAELMHLSDDLAALNQQRFSDWHTPFTEQNARQAIFTFKGDVYQAFDSDSLNVDDIDYAQRSMRMISGLYGLLRPLDLIQPYRLEMGTRLENSRGKNLYDFWGRMITEQLNAALELHQHQTIINLASAEYFKAVQVSHLKGDVITPKFKENINGIYKVIGIHAKKARGNMARFIVQNRIEKAEEIQSFASDAYCFQQHMSSDREWVFTR